MLGGRVKTLHPKIHGGILADRSKPDHLADLEAQGIEAIDLVVCNLYPFIDQPGIEMIDIGGPTMVRAAAKNHAHVAVVVDPASYGPVLDELRREGELSDATRRSLARAAFAHTAAYDAAIVSWLDGDEPLPDSIHLALERTDEKLRYGENPHQQGARYRSIGRSSWWDSIEQHSGLALSYLNLYDTEAAWQLVHDLGSGEAGLRHHQARQPLRRRRVVVVARRRVRAGVGGRREVGVRRDRRAERTGHRRRGRRHRRRAAGRRDHRPVVRPRHDRQAHRPAQGDAVCSQASAPGAEPFHFRQIGGGFLVQEPHQFKSPRTDWRVVTERQPTDDEWRDAELAWRLGGYVKSNSIVLVADGQAVGIGAGQQSRVDAGEIAAKKAAGRAKGGACASDAFYPFRDGIDAAASAGVAVVIQPGGSMRDDEIIAAADELGLAMVFTGERHFFH